jgi:hypothetical protein
VCLWSAADRILLSGDHLLPAITSPVTFERGFERDPMSSYLDSLQRVAALAPALVLPGHCDPFPDGSGRAAATSTGMPLLAVSRTTRFRTANCRASSSLAGNRPRSPSMTGSSLPNPARIVRSMSRVSRGRRARR